MAAPFLEAARYRACALRRACFRSAHLLMAAPCRACIRSAHLLMAAPLVEARAEFRRACIRRSSYSSEARTSSHPASEEDSEPCPRSHTAGPSWRLSQRWIPSAERIATSLPYKDASDCEIRPLLGRFLQFCRRT